METSRALIGHKHYTSNDRIKEVVWYGVKQLFHVLKGEGESQYWEFKGRVINLVFAHFRPIFFIYAPIAIIFGMYILCIK